jgi:hypothetical protein
MNNISAVPNVKTYPLRKFVQKTLADLSNSKALAPVILLETSVLSGRCYHANKRGGLVELKERFLEEFSTALVWFYGITSLNKIGDFIAKRSNIDTTIEFGKDQIPKEYGKLKQYMKSPLEKLMDGKPKAFKDLLIKTKFAKILLSSLTGIYIVGNVIPKFKNSMTENSKNSDNKNFLRSISSDLFKKNTQIKQSHVSFVNDNFAMGNFLEQTKNNNISFKNSSRLRTISHKLENDNICKMLTVDAGIIGGRVINARNDDEKIEIIFRDLASLYFYMASTHHINNFLADKNFNFFNLKLKGLGLDNKTGASTKLDPRIVQNINNNLLANYTNDTKSRLDFDKFMIDIFGKEDSKLVDKLKKAAENNSEKYTLNLDEFSQIVKSSKADNIENIMNCANKFAEFNKQIVGNSAENFIVSAQINDIIKAGLINEPDFFKESFAIAYPDVKSPNKYISLRSLDKTKENINMYAEGLKAQLENTLSNNKEITKKEFEKVIKQYQNKNLILKTLYIMTGLGISAYFLSSAIPNIQYYITRKRTGNDGFPGVKNINTN